MAKTAEQLQAVAWEIAKQIRAIPVAADNTHIRKRQLKREALFAGVPIDELPSVRTYVRQYMTVMASRERTWHQSNARLFAGNGKAQKHAGVIK